MFTEVQKNTVNFVSSSSNLSPSPEYNELLLSLHVKLTTNYSRTEVKISVNKICGEVPGVNDLARQVRWHIALHRRYDRPLFRTLVENGQVFWLKELKIPIKRKYQGCILEKKIYCPLISQWIRDVFTTSENTSCVGHRHQLHMTSSQLYTSNILPTNFPMDTWHFYHV